jgi:V/A-type H+-transporting ATPase subunit A
MRKPRADWNDLVREAMALLQRSGLLEIVQLVGPDALAESQRAELTVARLLREDFLQQSAYHEIDRFCPLSKAYWMLRVILEFQRQTAAALAAHITLDRITVLPVVAEIARMKELPVEGCVEKLQAVIARIDREMADLMKRKT